VLVAALLAVLASFVTTQPAAAADGRPFTNPIKAQKGADPWLEYYNGNYYLINTTFTNELLMRKSPTLAGLATAPSVQVWSDTTSGRNANMWAPEFHYFDGHAGGSTADGTNVLQWTCNGGANQKWRVEDQGNDTSRLVNVATGKVLDTADCCAADGADLRQWTWLNNNCQKYRLIYTGGDYVRIVNANSGKVADVADCSAADGTDVRQWTWLNNNCQQWRLTPTT
jgi:hypothetical protein